MSELRAALHTSIDVGLGGVLLANMLAGWLDSDPKGLPTAETAGEPEDHRTSPEQTGLHLFAPVDTGPSPPSSREHRAPVCTAGESAGTGLERIPDPYAGSGPGEDGDRDGGAAGLQDLGGGCFVGASGGSDCIGGLAVGALEPRLASIAGVVCAHRNAGDRRRWLLRPGRFQRRPSVGLEGSYGPGRASFFARAPPGWQAQQNPER